MDYLRRKIDKFLDDWLVSKTKKPIIIKGARQVGKTRTIEEFAKRNNLFIVEINFALEPKYIDIFDAGYKYVKWMAEGSACKFCREIAYKDNGYDEDGVYKVKNVPDIPVHPNCMCSISAYWVEDDKLPKKSDDESDGKLEAKNS